MRTEFDGDATVGVVVARQGNALTRREEQLRRWAESETSRAPVTPKAKPPGELMLNLIVALDTMPVRRCFQI